MTTSGSSIGQQWGQSGQGDNRTIFNCNKAGHIATTYPNNANTGRKYYKYRTRYSGK